MKKSVSVLELLKKLWIHIPSQRKVQFILLLLLAVFTSIAEIFSISATLPFISALTEPNNIYNNSLLQPLFHLFEIKSSKEIVFPLTVLFVIAIIISTSLRFTLLWVSTKLTFNTGIDLSLTIYQKILRQPYLFHTINNSSDIINVVNGKVSEVIFYIILPSLNLISSGIIALFVSILMLYFIPHSALFVMLIFVFTYIIIIKLMRKSLKINSQIIATESTQLIKTIQEGLGGIRDILIDGTQQNFSNKYKNSVESLRSAQAKSQIIGASPKFFLDGIGMLIVAFFAFILSNQTYGSLSMIPTLVAIVLSMQRLLPLLQQMFNSWSLIHSAQVSLADTIEYLNLITPHELDIQNSEKIVPIEFKNEIRLENISFQYSDSSALVLREINLIIPKGSHIGFIGETGSGKSTLLDLMMGLLEPTKGNIRIDNITLNTSLLPSWQTHIAHVPQSIYLIDSTIEENIAFGIDKNEINKGLVKEAATKAQIADVIEKMPFGYETIVGERGVQLSGGQRQRLGLARALYKKAQVIILDEATSALDGDTENNVMNVFTSLGDETTLLIIAHRLTTLRNCTNIVELKDGNITRILKYEELEQTREGNSCLN